MFLDDVRVPARNAIGQVDAALEVAAAYARDRRVFGRPIGANQAVLFPLAQLKAMA